ncbi:hypothetical protein [Streptomyces sp. NPDC050548]|uniref:hypothetical protein n=1 Tax=Streptomyces sp. NPDC050548 TaxID=3365629 RepID=UPI0037B9750D
MGTSLTPQFWQLFAVLLVAATGVTFVLTAVFDALALRLLHRRGRRTPTQAPQQPQTAKTHASVRC